MNKQWTVIAHPDYFTSFRNVVNNPDDRYQVTTGIRDYLKDVGDPRDVLPSVPGEPNLFELALLDYTIIVQWREEQPNEIKLLEVYSPGGHP